ncbi:MAG TPA: DUF4157 domain-containing protein [Candidatus Limnocylindrales bacterium]|nr:DUF4157 domain-containing protein [Candidatus Limnocylindrales bacterium]
MQDFEQAGRTHRRTPPTAPETSAAGPVTHESVHAPDRRAPLSPAAILGLQRTAGNASVVQLLGADEEAASPVHDVVGKGGGAPLDAGVRNEMEGRFGQSFSDVRVHTDAAASKSAESVGANAYTVGSDVVFRSGQFDTSSQVGQRTLAHELAHVVQQRSGPVDGSPAPGGINLSSPSDRFEQAAEQTAATVMAGGTPAAVEESDEAVQRVVQRDPTDDVEDEEEEPSLG